MTILHKTLHGDALSALDLFLNGALAPLSGYLDRDDHISVLDRNRLQNGYLWSLPFALPLSTTEKLQAQLSGRIALLDEHQRLLAEVSVTDLYRLPAALAGAGEDKVWYATGNITPAAKVLHPTFNRLRHNVAELRTTFGQFAWQSVIAVHAAPAIDTEDMYQACQWLKASSGQAGGILLQISAAADGTDLSRQMQETRAQVRCNAAKQVKISLLPQISNLSEQQQLLLQVRIARNYGATGFLLSRTVSPQAQRWLLQHQDETGLEIIPAKRSQRQAAQRTSQRLAA